MDSNAIMFVQQWFIRINCERTLWSEQPYIYYMNLYIETVCAMLGARLDVARPCALQGLSIVFSCAVCNKGKAGAKTLWEIKRNVDMKFYDSVSCLVVSDWPRGCGRSVLTRSPWQWLNPVCFQTASKQTNGVTRRNSLEFLFFVGLEVKEWEVFEWNRITVFQTMFN